ncbi:MAG TPA: nuclease-related domain-containing protein [Nocardioides sp.]|nr:nuclease-related domain-containing protein [Nocardioides sp.]
MVEGSAEERATVVALETLPRERWRVLHDVPWPGRPRDVIEHVVVGPAGVFVIDTKTWSGTVTVRAGVLRLDKYSRQGALTHVEEAARAVSAQLRTARCPVRPVLCLVRSESISTECDGVLVCSTTTLVDVLKSQHRVLPEVQIQRLARDLSGHALPLASARATPRRRRPGRGVTYLTGALAALLVALTLVASPDAVRDGVEGAMSWVADFVEDA